jgi:hypothetical protein
MHFLMSNLKTTVYGHIFISVLEDLPRVLGVDSTSLSALQFSFLCVCVFL